MDIIRIRPIILLVVMLLAFQTPICNGGRFRLQSSLVFHFQHGLHRLEAVYARTESNGNIEYGLRTDELLKGNEENGIAEEEEEEEEERRYERKVYPADKLLQTNKADGTVSYILGGY
ncbi:hypothetical protein SUGI_0591770 [Cryptomeria japonica]|uniref:uncharacterized protein LOC131030560 n=1 Tax=Cryptomeria japonica TaxID=3369 RepID=UPI002414AD54|nr:uncharacterized protein LOC131030560 [Cryptomeria japonica]GLJ29935.1 hypothetical protein SUGI_0591770 [Cryptomeria japonica]